MTWIDTVEPADADAALQKIYRRVSGGGDQVDNILKSHSLRPHTLEGHMALYKAALHHHGNKLPKWLLEAVGVLVSRLNGCSYCVKHHSVGLRNALDDKDRAEKLLEALTSEHWVDGFDDREVAIFEYTKTLTLTPNTCNEGLIEDMRKAGMSDGEILEINQVIAYFAYANRTVLGLGVTSGGETLGLAPGNNNDPDDWGHR